MLSAVYPEPQNALRISSGMNVPDSPCGITSRLRPLKSVVDDTPRGAPKPLAQARGTGFTGKEDRPSPESSSSCNGAVRLPPLHSTH